MKTFATNKRARHDYDLKETYEAGLVLSGQEVKSVKLGHASLKGSFVTLQGSELYLTNAHISPYKYAGEMPSYDPTQPRKLLLKKNEIASLIGKSKTEGLTLVPLQLFQGPRGFIKLAFAVGRGKKQYDKRADISFRESKRKIERALKNRFQER